MKRLATIGRWLFSFAAVVSLLLGLVFGGLGARSVRHFELVQVRHVRWPQEMDMYCEYAGLTWYGSTLRLEVTRTRSGPEEMPTAEQMQADRAHFPPGFMGGFVGEETTAMLSTYPEGFRFQRYVSATGGFSDSNTILSVRAWLPTLLASMLPAIWLILYRRRKGTLWRVGLRELFVLVTVFAVGLCGVLLLLR